MNRDSSAATAIVIGASIAYFSTSGVAFPVLPELVKETSGGGNTKIGFAFAALGMGMLVARPFVGFLNDRFGRTRMVGLGAFGLVLVQLVYVPAAEAGFRFLFGARFVGGILSSAMYVGLATIATEMPTPERRAKVFSWFSASVFLGFALGPVVGEFVLDAFGFRWAFAAAAAFMAVTAAASLVLPETRPDDVNPRLGGMREIFDPIGGRVGLASFVAIVSFMGFQGYVKQWGLELGVESAGLILSTYAVVALLLRVFAVKPLDGDRIAVGTFALVSLAVAAGVFAAAQNAAWLYVGAVILALGSAFATPVLLLIATDSTPAAARARVVSTVTFANDVGASAGIPLLGVIADAAGFPAMYIALGVVVLLALAYFRSPAITSLPGAARTRSAPPT